VQGNVDDIKRRVRVDRIDQVWIALPLRASDRVAQLLHELVSMNVKVRFVPDIFGFQLLNHSFTEVCGFPVINVSESPFSGLKGTLKWIEDKVLALLILAIILPLLLVIAVGVKLSSPGPVLFRQRRGGLDNREIVVWKFRTMAVHDETEIAGVPQARRNDPRVTPFGAFLRRASLDELPQFVNVLVGNMSIVGPRPHPLWLNDYYRDKTPQGDKVDYWVSDTVPPFGLVKLEVDQKNNPQIQGKMKLELTGLGKDAKQVITKPAKPFDQAALMQQMLGAAGGPPGGGAKPGAKPAAPPPAAAPPPPAPAPKK